MAPPEDPRQFRYTPLEQDSLSTRLVQIVAPPRQGTCNGLLQLSIKKTSLVKHELVDYICLSYRWGSSAGSVPVLISDQDSGEKGQLLVQPNLYDFLLVWYQRHRARPRRRLDIIRRRDASVVIPWLWIDALCINQADNSERGHQVHKMGVIYRSATAVHIWLGREPGSRSLFSEAAAALREQIDNEKLWKSIRTDPEVDNEQHRKLRPSDTLIRDATILIRNLNRDVQPLLRFYYGNEYWHRLWIIQEIVLASKVFVVCGTSHEELSITKCDRLMHLLYESTRHSPARSLLRGKILKQLLVSENHSPDHVSTRETYERLFRLRQEFTKLNGLIPLNRLFYELGMLRPACSEVLDQVYGVLAIGQGLSHLKVDHEASPWSVFVGICTLPRHRDTEPYAHWNPLLERLDVDLAKMYDKLAGDPDIAARKLRFQRVFYTKKASTVSFILNQESCEQCCRGLSAEAKRQQHRFYRGWLRLGKGAQCEVVLYQDLTKDHLQVAGFIYTLSSEQKDLRRPEKVFVPAIEGEVTLHPIHIFSADDSPKKFVVDIEISELTFLRQAFLFQYPDSKKARSLSRLETANQRILRPSEITHWIRHRRIANDGPFSSSYTSRRSRRGLLSDLDRVDINPTSFRAQIIEAALYRDLDLSDMSETESDISDLFSEEPTRIL